MAKKAPDATLDSFLKYIAECDRLFVCTTEPTDYNDASAVKDLATVVMTPGDGLGDFVIADDAVLGGRKLTIGAQAGMTIDTSGNAEHIALGKSGDTTLRYVTTCTTQALVAAGTVDVPAWKITIGDPT